MGNNFIALFDASPQSSNPKWLCEELTTHPDALTEIIERYRDRWLPKLWGGEPLVATGESELRGPGGFSIRFRPRTLELYHMMRFSTFTGDLLSRTALRRACLFIADLASSERAIYTHELMPYPGEGLKQIEAGIRVHIGPPAATFEELHAAEYFGPRAWYIDTFTDLRNS